MLRKGMNVAAACFQRKNDCFYIILITDGINVKLQKPFSFEVFMYGVIGVHFCGLLCTRCDESMKSNGVMKHSFLRDGNAS